MNLTKILFAVALIAFSCITFASSLKCYVCDSKSSCQKAKKYDCNPLLANTTRAYLDLYHTGVSVNVTSWNYYCFREDIKFTNGELYYRGCTYDNIKGCSYPLRSYLTTGKYEHYCNECSNKDGCNPAGRANINMMTVFATIIVAWLVKLVWH